MIAEGRKRTLVIRMNPNTVKCLGKSEDARMGEETVRVYLFVFINMRYFVFFSNDNISVVVVFAVYR